MSVRCLPVISSRPLPMSSVLQVEVPSVLLVFLVAPLPFTPSLRVLERRISHNRELGYAMLSKSTIREHSTNIAGKEKRRAIELLNLIWCQRKEGWKERLAHWLDLRDLVALLSLIREFSPTFRWWTRFISNSNSPLFYLSEVGSNQKRLRQACSLPY